MTELPLKVQEVFTEGTNNVESHASSHEDRRLDSSCGASRRVLRVLARLVLFRPHFRSPPQAENLKQPNVKTNERTNRRTDEQMNDGTKRVHAALAIKGNSSCTLYVSGKV